MNAVDGGAETGAFDVGGQSLKLRKSVRILARIKVGTDDDRCAVSISRVVGLRKATPLMPARGEQPEKDCL